MDVSSYILSKRYTDDTIIGAGAIKGASCQISNIEQIEGGHNITFSWKLLDDSTRTATIFIKDGEEGADGSTPEIGPNGNWFINGVDTGTIAAPDLAGYYNEENLVSLTNEEIDAICKKEA